MKIFHHDDADGRCAAFLVREFACAAGDRSRLIEMDYRDPFPLFDGTVIGPGEQVWILDFSIPPDQMSVLVERTPDIIWIDHHRTAINDYEKFPLRIPGIRRDGEAACVLTWEYLLGCGCMPVSMSGAPPPLFVQLIGDRDVWRFARGDDTRHFHLGLQAHDTRPHAEVWRKLLRSPPYTLRLIEDGRTIGGYRDALAADHLRKWGFPAEFEGHRCLAVNAAGWGSEHFASAAGYDILAPFAFDGEMWTVTLYSGTVDVSKIAVRHGGGGHMGAAGFTCRELPFARGT
jgi:oligoribonuclease NrnB/cAMP/cGMP phosphodiesterase (DHH superfamily)